MKINKKGFFLSETMVVISVVAVVLLSVFKLFNSVYYRFIQTENYNTTNAINALSNIQKYYESIDNIDVSVITEDISYVDLTNAEKYESEYYTRLKEELNINSIYLMDLNKLNDLSKFHITLRKYLDTLRNEQGIILLISVNGNEFAYTKISDYSSVNLVGNEKDEYAVYIQIGNEFIDPGYENWEGDEPTTYWEDGKEIDINKTGTYYLHYDFNGKLFRRKVVVGDFIVDFAYTGSYQVYEVPYSGYYKVELWGASGGGSDETGGNGGYSTGVIKLNKNEQLYIYAGSHGNEYDSIRGYNGGGWSNPDVNTGWNGVVGGGATDIRYFGNVTPSTVDLLWNSVLGLNSRIMVAGGGGGAEWQGNVGGSGGGLISGKVISSYDYDGSLLANSYYSYGGTQTSGGTADLVDGYSWTGGFGYGGYTEEYIDAGGMGGGGYYGGGSMHHAFAGGGGSSFISGYAGVNAIKSSTDRTHTNNTIHYSNKYFIDGQMQAGVNSGNGKAIITYLGTTYEKKNTKLNNVRYVKDCTNGNSVNNDNHWVEIQAINNGVNVAYGKTVAATTSVNTSYGAKKWEVLTDGDITSSMYAQTSVNGSLQCVTVDLENNYDLDEIAVWHYYKDGRSYNNHSLYVSSDNSTWTTLINNVSGVKETSNGIRVSAYD